MKSTARIFYILSAFFVVVGIAYGIITGRNEPMGIEPVGFAAFLAAAGLALLIAIYLSMNVKAHPDRPEDNLHAEVEDEAGVQGIFAPYSWWPLWLGLSTTIMVAGIGIGWWLFIVAAPFVMISVVGWTMEFFRGAKAV